MDESRVKEKKKPQMEQESKEFEMRERIRQEQMEYEKNQRKPVAEEHKRQELEIMENQRIFEEKLEQDRLKHIREAQMASKPLRLQITKFRGTVPDWPRFWAQFKEDIDETKQKPVKKFSLLKELVGKTDHTVIENLPSDKAGYNHAKKLLEDKYGDTNEIMAAYMEQIAQLPTIHGVDVNRIHAFYAKLASCAHVLETMKLIGDIKGSLRMTLIKLPGIRENLIAKDENWTNWGFPELVKALESWTRRNPKTVDVDLGTKRNEKPVFKSSKKERIYAMKDRQ